MKKKLALVYKPFLTSFLGLLIGYTFLHWLLFIKLDLFPVKEIVVDMGVPLALSFAVALLVIRPWLKILNLKTKKGSWIDFYSFILCILMSIPLLVAQAYLETATGKLTELGSIKEINKVPPTKYYSLRRYYIDKKFVGLHTTFETSGKRNESFNMRIYVAMPIFETAKDTLGDMPVAWLGMKYSNTVSNRLDQTEKERRYKKFASECEKDFDGKDVSQFVYLNKIGYSDDQTGYKEAVKARNQYMPNTVILESVNAPFAARNGKKLEWLLGTSIGGALVWLIMVCIPKIDPRALRSMRKGNLRKKNIAGVKETISILLLPNKTIFITPILLDLNVLVYLVMFLSGLGFISFSGSDLILWGANYKPLTVDGQWWRLLTNMFLHGGIMHLLANMYGFLFVGIFLEPLLGKWKYLGVYLVTCIVASINSLWWHDATVSIGASGAIFGLYGFFLACLLLKVFPPDFSKGFLASTLIFVGANLLMGLGGGIDNAAHIGGLVSGFLLGLVMSRQLKETN